MDRNRFGAKTIEEAVERWRRGDPVWSVEMGGLGPGYEQAIQIGVFETAGEFLDPKKRKLLDKKEKADGEDGIHEVMDETLTHVSKRCKLGLSGAQAGAIKSMVYKFLKHGYEEMLLKAPQDRLIQVSRDFPCVVGEKK